MRLALIIWSLEGGGAERVMSTLAGAWADRQNVTLITLAGETPDHYELGGDVTRIRLMMKPAESLWGTVLTNLSLVSGLRKTLHELSPDVVVSFMDRTNNQVLVATRGMGLPVVVSERTDPRQHRIPGKAQVLRKLAYPRADGVVVQTEAVRPWAEGLVHPARVWVIPNPVLSCSTGQAVRAMSVVGMGRLSPEKGFDVLLRAFALVAPNQPDWRLRIIGEGPERNHLESIARSLGVANRVEFPGITRDPEAELAAAGLFVLSSRYEGFPNVLLEAMACGTPSMATDCPSGPGEILTPDVDGILVPPDDVEELATALDNLLSDGSLRQRLGAAAQMSVRRYSIGTVAEQWESLFDTVRARKAGKRNRL